MKYITINEVCGSVKKHITPRSGEYYHLYSLPAFDNEMTPECVDGSEIKSSKLCVENNCILFNKLNVHFKRIWNIHNLTDSNAICSTEFIPLVVNKNVDQDYLYYVLTSETLTKKMYASRKGTSNSQQRIDEKILFSYEMPIHIMDTQKKIAHVLKSIDNKIDNNKRIIDNLVSQANELFKHFYVANLEGNEKKWATGKLIDIIDIHDTKRKPLSNVQRSQMTNRTFRYYGAASVMDYVDDYLFDGIYLLLGEDGSVMDKKGYPILQYVWGRFWVNNHAHVLTGRNGFSTEMTYLLMKNTNVKRIVTGAVQGKISQTNLKSIDILLPSKSECSDFRKKTDPIFENVRKLYDINNNLLELKNTLLPKLLNGEVDAAKVKIEE